MFATRKSVTELSFGAAGVSSKVTETPGKAPDQRSGALISRICSICNRRCFICAASRFRSAASSGSLFIPPTSAYLATSPCWAANVVTVPSGTYNAIKFDLQLNKIGKTGRARAASKIPSRHAPGSRMIPIGFCCGSKRRFLSAPSSPNCSRWSSRIRSRSCS